MNLQLLKFPIGEYTPNRHPDRDTLEQWIQEIEEFPAKVEAVTKSLPPEQLNWRYRPGGWTIKQVVHHCADSHINSLVRFKLALTEDRPTIRPYFEERWANLPDAQDDDIEASLNLLQGLHQRWGLLLRSLSDAQLAREFVHPEHGQAFNLAETIGNYAWHCRHHFAHLQQGIASQGAYN